MEHQLQSDEINELAQALCKAQGTISGARKDKTNPFFKSNYADLGSVTEAIRESFCENDLAYTQTNLPADNGVTVVTTLMHKSGQWIRGFLFLPATKLDPQQFGSAITYARRYGLAAMAGVVQEDDDGNGASKGAANTTTQPNNKPFGLPKFAAAIKSCKTGEEVSRTSKAWADAIGNWTDNDKAEARKTVQHRKDEFNAGG